MVEGNAAAARPGSAGPVQSKPMTNNFSRNILKRVVGFEKAQRAFQSITMGTIPKASSFGDVGSKAGSASII